VAAILLGGESPDKKKEETCRKITKVLETSS
jgi:hypothetical protein